MWRLHETCVENFLFSGVLCPCRAMCAVEVQCTYGIRHMFYVLACPLSVLPFSAHAHIRRQGCAHLVAVCFWGNTVLADFPSVVRRGGAVWCWSVHTQFIPAVQCSVVGCRSAVLVHQHSEESSSMAEEAAFLRLVGSCHPPFGWQALAKPSSACALHGTYLLQPASQCTHTPVQWRP